MNKVLSGNKSKYIVMAIAAILVMAVGVSFCAWDTTSLSKAFSGVAADYGKAYFLATDVNNNATADVGDTVHFGKFYQDANQDTKTRLEWVVADIRKESVGGKDKDVMYLVTKDIVAAGTFYCDPYYTAGGQIMHPSGYRNNQCYNESTVRAWLNSSATRTDGGEQYNQTIASRKVMNGFYNEAFGSIEREAIIPRNLGSMQGYSAMKDNGDTFFTYPELTSEKVWLPSYKEVTGLRTVSGAVDGEQIVYDSPNDRQFSHFTVLNNRNTNKSNFANSKFGWYNNSKNEWARTAAAGWLVRTPSALTGNNGTVRKNELILMVNTVGGGVSGGGYSILETGSARPGVCVAR